MDAARGLFLVADGLGGHAAGERAAETAVEMIAARLERQTGTAEERMREAIAVANNEIHTQATQNPEWNGMACVVTVALIEDGQVVVGHVGDSRLYVLESGAIRKATHDHSPVGELEDAGKLSEAAAMAHPRRNEVFRDLGSEPHGPQDEDFIEVQRFPFRAGMALLLCSDGLSDQVTAQEIRRLVEANPRDPQGAVRALVDAANEAGGKDNVSVVLVEGPEYGARRAPAAAPVPLQSRRPSPVLPLFSGFLLALAAMALVRPYVMETAGGFQLGYGTVREPQTWKVGAGGRETISEALALARSGDTILVEPGTYHENLHLRSGVALVSARRRGAVLDGGDVMVAAEGVNHARFAGFKVKGPARIGIRIVNSDVEVTDVEVTGMTESGIEVEGESPSLIRANTVVANPGAGIVVRGAARPAITNNFISGNGKTPGALRPGLHIAGTAEPVVTGNIIADSGVEQIWASPLFNAESLAATNTLAPGAKDRRNLIKVVTR